MAKQFVAAAGTATAATAATTTTAGAEATTAATSTKASTTTTTAATTTAVVQRENIENLVSSRSKNEQNKTKQLFLFLRESMNVRTKISENDFFPASVTFARINNFPN